MSFDEIMEQALDMLRRRGRVSYRALKRQFDLDDEYLTDLKDEILYSQSDAVEDADRGLIWNGTPSERNLDEQSETDGESLTHTSCAAKKTPRRCFSNDYYSRLLKPQYNPGNNMDDLHRKGISQKHFVFGRLPLLLMLALACLAFMQQAVWAHAVTEGDKGYIQEISGVYFIPFMYLGAKHMITGYDHLLFLAGVIFFLYRMKDIGIYVTLFAIGHSTTMILGVYYNITISSYIIDAIIGLSVVYKALDNMGAYQRWFGFQPNTKAATLIFGLFHGFGLATKVQEYEVAPDGLLTNLIAFNLGVEVGQLLALAAILIAMSYWRRSGSFWRHAYTANVVMMTAGFILVGMHLTGYFTTLHS